MVAKTELAMRFTGKAILALDRVIPATCIVRNELNGWRQADQIVRTHGSTVPHGIPYQPRPFPPGQWNITNVSDMDADTEFWPRWIGTEAYQTLDAWILDDRGRYLCPYDFTIVGRGYGLHHARYRKDDVMVPSNTTLGCINILKPDDSKWLAMKVREFLGYRLPVFIDVPEWNEWEA